ncbi:MAG: hypothetical protein BGO30_09030 [Bacteroidetes bacterium 41-46]|jgi:hypothetical protein|nr:MAG: hypothetical protein BGO30_09030 [Bacteroidetes bacterium 41-46]
MRVISKLLAFTALIFLSVNLYSQELKKGEEEIKLSAHHQIALNIAKSLEIPEPVKPAEIVPNPWSKGALFQLGFSQMSLTNWAAGGFSSVALNAYVNMYNGWEVDQMFWQNRLQLAWGFINSFGDRFKKSDDKIIFDSKYGYRAFNKVFVSAAFNFRSQFSNSFNYPASGDKVLVSGPFSPAYFSFGIGMDYKPAKVLSINFSPLTSNLVIVAQESLRTKYGNRVDQPAKLELGAQLKIDYKHQLTKDLLIASNLVLFSDFLNKPQNIKVYWDLFVDTKINKYFSVNVRTNLIYDDNILIADKNGELDKRVQFKEILTVGFSYTFGQFKK